MCVVCVLKTLRFLCLQKLRIAVVMATWSVWMADWCRMPCGKRSQAITSPFLPVLRSSRSHHRNANSPLFRPLMPNHPHLPHYIHVRIVAIVLWHVNGVNRVWASAEWLELTPPLSLSLCLCLCSATSDKSFLRRNSRGGRWCRLHHHQLRQKSLQNILIIYTLLLSWPTMRCCTSARIMIMWRGEASREPSVYVCVFDLMTPSPSWIER